MDLMGKVWENQRNRTDYHGWIFIFTIVSMVILPLQLHKKSSFEMPQSRSQSRQLLRRYGIGMAQIPWFCRVTSTPSKWIPMSQPMRPRDGLRRILEERFSAMLFCPGWVGFKRDFLEGKSRHFLAMVSSKQKSQHLVLSENLEETRLEWSIIVSQLSLVGGLVAIFYCPINLGNLIIPIDELIFFRGVAQPPTRYLMTSWAVRIFTHIGRASSTG